MTKRVFEPEAVAACDRDGHRFKWVSTSQTWPNNGFEECRRCGASGRGGLRPDLYGDHAAEPDVEDPDRSRRVERNEAILAARAAGGPGSKLAELAERFGLSEQMISRICVDAAKDGSDA